MLINPRKRRLMLWNQALAKTEADRTLFDFACMTACDARGHQVPGVQQRAEILRLRAEKLAHKRVIPATRDIRAEYRAQLSIPITRP